MTQVLSTQTNEFQFQDDIISQDRCSLNITVLHKKYENGNEYYYIDYTYTFPEDQVQNIQNRAHPFHKYPKGEVNGVIVFKNAVTDSLVNYLLMDDTELYPYTGTTTPMAYRKIIMKTLDTLWD